MWKMAESHRLSSGGRIDRGRPLTFTFDGRPYRGYAGDTLASALLANGVGIVGRSFKYHRPRGLFTAGPEEPNGIVQIGAPPTEEPNAKAPVTELYDGLAAKSVNCWPTASRDILAVTGLAAPLLVAGFYYKTFKWPGWRLFSPVVRHMAGLGTVPKAADPDDYDRRHAHSDCLIVGGGPAGLAAALSAADTGKRVILVDEQCELGGSFLWERETLDGSAATAWVETAAAELNARANVTVLTRATASGYYDHNLVTVVERVRDHLPPGDGADLPRERFLRIRAGQVILATGSIERPLVFPNNDRPGIMLASAMRHYVNRYAVAPGRTVLLYTNNDSAYRSALDLQAAGVRVAGVVDVRAEPAGRLPGLAARAGIPVFAGHAVVDTRGRRGIRSAVLAPIDLESGTLGTDRRTVACDALGTSGGWSPSVHLHSQSGGKLRFDEEKCCFVPSAAAQNCVSIGAANGVFELDACFAEGVAAGGGDISLPDAGSRPDAPMAALWDLPADQPAIGNAKRWVDLLHDVTANDVALAARENFRSVEHFKRYTTTGMATDQGKTSNVNALAILGQVTGRSIPQVGTTKFRPPYTPVTMGTVAAGATGELAAPLRRLPMHGWHIAHGGALEEFGGWLRPVCYPQGGEDEHAAVEREVLNVRRNVGLLDYSPLGKIDVRGPDAAEFLNRLYINNVKSLKIGRARYGVMLDEHGAIMDDGIFARLADDHFWVMTTSAGASRAYRWFEEWRQCEYPQFRVAIAPITSGWGTISIQGPKARELLMRLASDIDLGPKAFAHMAVRAGTLCDVPCRIVRASFTGELGFEVSVPRGYAQALWCALMEAGDALGAQPFGVEALMVMRTEKGFIHVGVDTDTGVIPDDVGLGGIARNKSEDFVGKRSLMRPDAVRDDRERLIGLRAAGGALLPSGGIILAPGHAKAPAPMQGRVTSSYWSPTLDRPVALGLIKGGAARRGEMVTIYDADGTHQAEVVAPCAYDPDGERIRG